MNFFLFLLIIYNLNRFLFEVIGMGMSQTAINTGGAPTSGGKKNARGI